MCVLNHVLNGRAAKYQFQSIFCLTRIGYNQLPSAEELGTLLEDRRVGFCSKNKPALSLFYNIYIYILNNYVDTITLLH